MQQPSKTETGLTGGAAAPVSEARQKVPSSAFPVCFYKDAFVPWEQAMIHANSLAMRYALSVFEGIRLYARSGGEKVLPFRLRAHLDRLRNSLRLMRLPEPEGSKAGIIEELVERNNVREDAYVRVSVSADNFGDIGAEVRS